MDIKRFKLNAKLKINLSHTIFIKKLENFKNFKSYGFFFTRRNENSRLNRNMSRFSDIEDKMQSFSEQMLLYTNISLIRSPKLPKDTKNWSFPTVYKIANEILRDFVRDFGKNLF